MCVCMLTGHQGVLLAIAVTLLLVEALPVLGEPTSSMHTLRVYGWFTMALSLSILLVAISLLCKYWVTTNVSWIPPPINAAERSVSSINYC